MCGGANLGRKRDRKRGQQTQLLKFIQFTTCKFSTYNPSSYSRRFPLFRRHRLLCMPHVTCVVRTPLSHEDHPACVYGKRRKKERGRGEATMAINKFGGEREQEMAISSSLSLSLSLSLSNLRPLDISFFCMPGGRDVYRTIKEGWFPPLIPSFLRRNIPHFLAVCGTT